MKLISCAALAAAFPLFPAFAQQAPAPVQLNLFDKKYQIRSGSGVGVGAPQWGQRRGIFVGISKKFG